MEVRDLLLILAVLSLEKETLLATAYDAGRIPEPVKFNTETAKTNLLDGQEGVWTIKVKWILGK